MSLDLKGFLRYISNPNPTIYKMRNYFHENDKSIFLSTDWMQSSFQDKFKFFISNLIKLYKHIEQNYPEEFNDLIFRAHFVSPMGGIYLTFHGFYPPMKLLSTDEQCAKWEKLMLEGRLIGAYAQTEVGHGSDVQSLQTTATYDKEKKCFILNSPTLNSAKFWPGALGILCNYALCQAQTYVNGKYYGLQTFIVPVRDTKTYKLIDGVEAGDIGPKLGYGGTDNGYLQFKNYHVPRDSLLMRFIKVDEDGNVETTHDKNAIKIGYGGMLGLRVALSLYFVFETYRGTLMSWQQWKKEGRLGSFERRKLLKEFAFVYSGFLSLNRLTDMHKHFMVTVQKDVKAALRELEELHLIVCGIKADYSWRVVDVLRRFSVDHSVGSLLSGGIVGSYSERVPTVTYEGDNVVMLQQTARGLCKYMQNVENEEFKKIPASFKFLAELRGVLEKPDEIKAKIENASELLNLNKIEEIINVISIFCVKECYEKMKEKLMGGESVNRMWNEQLQELMINMASTVTRGLNFKMARQVLENPETKSKLQESDYKLLENIILVSGLEILQKDLNNACRFKIGAAPEKLKALLREAEETLYKTLEDKVDYIGSSHSFFEEELYYVRDYEKAAAKAGVKDRIKATLEKDAQVKQKYINTFSKL